jgi:tRNA (mo5U34)-methyltransferase
VVPEVSAQEVAEHSWYHTLELGPRIVTPGYFDTRSIAGLIPFPPSLAGRRCLDVGTFDGFWAFEMEQRGAGEVVAIDELDPERWDWPAATRGQDRIDLRRRPGAGFEIASRALGSSVVRREVNVYELDPDEIGTFDLVYVGSLLLHLRDPVGALIRVRSVCSGDLVVTDAVDPVLTLRSPRRPAATLDGIGRPWWWRPNTAGLARMVEAAGFDVVDRPRRFFMPFGVAGERPSRTLRSFLGPNRLDRALLAFRGDPHATLRARPA